MTHCPPLWIPLLTASASTSGTPCNPERILCLHGSFWVGRQGWMDLNEILFGKVGSINTWLGGQNCCWPQHGRGR
eukprot:14953382-Ditylum_brightwellii.AAC.1